MHCMLLFLCQLSFHYSLNFFQLHGIPFVVVLLGRWIHCVAIKPLRELVRVVLPRSCLMLLRMLHDCKWKFQPVPLPSYLQSSKWKSVANHSIVFLIPSLDDDPPGWCNYAQPHSSLRRAIIIICWTDPSRCLHYCDTSTLILSFCTSTKEEHRSTKMKAGQENIATLIDSWLEVKCFVKIVKDKLDNLVA